VNEVRWEINTALKKREKDNSLPSVCNWINKQTIEEPSQIRKSLSYYDEGMFFKLALQIAAVIEH